MARMARWCDSNAQASASSRVTPASRAVLSPTVSAMLNGGASGVSGLPGESQNAGTPSGPGLEVEGAVDIDSVPPPMPTSIIPAAMFAATHWVPPMPEAHQRWVARFGTEVMPRRTATLRPMLPPPWNDSPKPMSSIWSTGMPERFTASPTATSARAKASTSTSDPL
jgi:hypothetical protein